MANIEINQCFLVNNDCYKQGRRIKPAGIVVHSTGANNPYIKRYVQPDDGIIGKNPNNNHWNKSGISKCVHAFIGKDKNGQVRIYQTLPWDYRCWGCGSGRKGSYNRNYIQFEICEDALSDANYFNDAFELAIKLCAYLRDKYNFPVKNIVSHHEAHTLGYASNHADCDHWLKRFKKNMNWFRDQVNAECGITVNPTPKPKPATTPSTAKYIYNGVDYELVFDPTYYANKYPDLKSAFGNNAAALFNHFCSHGMVEKRKAIVSFDVEVYKNNYADLQKAFGNNYPKYYEHYCVCGKKEGRKAI